MDGARNTQLPEAIARAGVVLAASRAPRFLHVARAISAPITAGKGIVAGDPVATTITRGVTLRAVDRVVDQCPVAELSICIDDIAMGAIGSHEHVGDMVQIAASSQKSCWRTRARFRS